MGRFYFDRHFQRSWFMEVHCFGPVARWKLAVVGCKERSVEGRGRGRGRREREREQGFLSKVHPLLQHAGLRADLTGVTGNEETTGWAMTETQQHHPGSSVYFLCTECGGGSIGKLSRRADSACSHLGGGGCLDTSCSHCFLLNVNCQGLH